MDIARQEPSADRTRDPHYAQAGPALLRVPARVSSVSVLGFGSMLTNGGEYSRGAVTIL
jgi:hypothetical protein